MTLTESVRMLPIGSSMPAFRLENIDGKAFSSASITAKATLVVFMCNHCPYVKAKISAIVGLHRKFAQAGLQVIGINSNDSRKYPDDSFANMQKFAAERNIAFPYLHDESQAVARTFGASCTPDPFLFDQTGKLAYHGRIDDAQEPGQVPNKHIMAEAIEALLAGKKPAQDFLPSIGCSIKWR